MTSECANCGDRTRTVSHHTNYRNDETVQVCHPCHGKIHSDPGHPLYPDDNPRGTVQIPIPAEARRSLRQFKGTWGYGDTIQWLIDNAPDGFPGKVSDPGELNVTIDEEGRFVVPKAHREALGIDGSSAYLDLQIRVLEREITGGE